MKSQKIKNSGIFENYKPKEKIVKCKDCGLEFTQKGTAKFKRKYCDKCSKKRKDDYANLWKVCANDCDD